LVRVLMRINVYDEEVTGEVDLIVKHGVVGADGTPVSFYGLRIYMDGSSKLHNTEFDDDRSAITFWSQDVNKLFGLAIVMQQASQLPAAEVS